MPQETPVARVTLEQWRVLHAIVGAGGYAQAAARLHKSQSAVTYAVQKIERVLGVEIFRMEGRRAVLTETGRLLWRRADALLREAGAIERVAGHLAAGWEAQLRLAVDIIFPTWLLLDCLGRFGAEHPDTRIELFETVLGGTEEALTGGQVDLAVTPLVPPGFVGEPLLRVRFLAVAAPTHPLHALGRPVTQADLRRHRQLVVRDSGATRSQDAGWLGAEARWTLAHKATSIRAACMGLGFSWYAEGTIREELASGALKPLPLAAGAERWAELYLVLAEGESAGPGARQLAALLAAAAADVTSGKRPPDAR